MQLFIEYGVINIKSKTERLSLMKRTLYYMEA